jgi:hypothetical protein
MGNSNTLKEAVSRREALIRAGWTVPAIFALTLPAVASSGSQVGADGAYSSPTGTYSTPTGTYSTPTGT